MVCVLMFKFIVALLPLVHDRKTSGLEIKKLKQKIAEVRMHQSCHYCHYKLYTHLDAKKTQRISFCSASC
jgi:hypothetical protein